MRVVQMIRALGLSMVLLGLSAACSNTRDYAGDEVDGERFVSNGDFANFTTTNLQLLGGHLAGDIGAVNGFDEEATLSGSHDQNFTAIELVVVTENGSAMNALQIYGGIDHEDLAPGAQLAFDVDTYDAQTDGVFIMGVACYGRGAPGAWDYDQPLDAVTVDVEAGESDDRRRLHFTTVSSGQVATGTLDIALVAP